MNPKTSNPNRGADSYIHAGPGGTLFVGPDANLLLQAATLRAAIRLLQVGISPRRGFTKRKALDAAQGLMKLPRPYRLNELQKASADLRTWIDTMRAALPITVESPDAQI